MFVQRTGTHEVGFKTAMTRVFNEYARRINELKDKDKNLGSNDIREGLTAIISVRIPEELLQFEGQTEIKTWHFRSKECCRLCCFRKITILLRRKGPIIKSLVKKQLSSTSTRGCS